MHSVSLYCHSLNSNAIIGRLYLFPCCCCCCLSPPSFHVCSQEAPSQQQPQSVRRGSLTGAQIGALVFLVNPIVSTKILDPFARDAFARRRRQAPMVMLALCGVKMLPGAFMTHLLAHSRLDHKLTH